MLKDVLEQSPAVCRRVPYMATSGICRMFFTFCIACEPPTHLHTHWGTHVDASYTLGRQWTTLSVGL